MVQAAEVIEKAESEFAGVFGRSYPGLAEAYRCTDAEYVVVTLGSIAGLVRQVVDELREQGVAAGMLKVRYMRPFPSEQVADALAGARVAAVLEKDVSFGAEGTVFTNVNSALHVAGVTTPTFNYIGGLGGDDITPEQVHGIFADLADSMDGFVDLEPVNFLGIKDERGGM